jgi:hypothetical protein
MREGCKSSGASEAQGSGVGEKWRGEIFDRGRPTRGRGESDRWGLVDRETRERRPAREGVIRKGKCISCEDVINARVAWAGWDCFGLRGTARPVGWLDAQETVLTHTIMKHSASLFSGLDAQECTTQPADPTSYRNTSSA